MRRSALEHEGYIHGFRAYLDKEAAGVALTSMVSKHEFIANVKTAIVLDSLEETSALPLYKGAVEQ